MKSYSKTKPLRVEELQPIADWWGQESKGFKDRVETEQAWKVDFKSIKQDAEAKAKPHWDKSEDLKNQAAFARRQAKYLNDSLVGRKNDKDLKAYLSNQLEDLKIDLIKQDGRSYTDVLVEALEKAVSCNTHGKVIESLEQSIGVLKSLADDLTMKAKDEQAAGDRHYWPIYNLDIKNPNVHEEESLDPDALLKKYKKLLGEIEQTQNQLRDELAAALSHHFETGESAS